MVPEAGDWLMRRCRLMVIDDPVKYRNRHTMRKDGGKTRSGIGAAQHYSLGVMEEADLIAMGPAIRAVLAPDAVVMAWATGPNLDMHFRIMQGRGFQYVTLGAVWAKVYPKSQGFFRGPGRHVPANAELLCHWKVPGHEPVWYPNTGKKPCQVLAVPHPRGADGKIIHSRKPEDPQAGFDGWLDPHIGDFSKIELFATRRRPGWICLGYDVTGRDIREDLEDMAMQIRMTEALSCL